MKNNEIEEVWKEPIIGKIAYDPSRFIIGLDKDNMCFHYKDLEEVMLWTAMHARSFNPETRDKDIINGLLSEGIINA